MNQQKETKVSNLNITVLPENTTIHAKEVAPKLPIETVVTQEFSVHKKKNQSAAPETLIK